MAASMDMTLPLATSVADSPMHFNNGKSQFY